ncbi:MAG: multiheme c-type cytochrome [Candidatus Aminicenantales bacterium]
MRKKIKHGIFPAVIFLPILILIAALSSAPKKSYDQFETPKRCAQCHRDIYTQWKQTMMAQAYTHHWDEIEYFKLALPQAEKDPKVAEIKAGCNGCHTPVALYVGDIPPQPPSANTRANDSVFCDVCHSVSGYSGELPFNFNYNLSPGNIKYGPRQGVVSPHHETRYSDFIKSPDFCGTCHNEKNPYGIWVKSTHLEWKEGPYSKQGVRCHDCHMWHAPGKSADMGEPLQDMANHNFPGGHVLAKIRGAIEMKVYGDAEELFPGDKTVISVHLYNAKAGHKIPTGSVEDRQLWLEVHAVDAKGNRYLLPVDRKGFEGEEYTISSNALAYQDMGDMMMDIKDFKGVQRDDIEEGHRVFRLPYFDPKGRMTIGQWNTASQGVDYRIGPRETKIETYTWTTPQTLPEGILRIEARLQYRLLVKSVAEFLGVPADEFEIKEINSADTEIRIIY